MQLLPGIADMLHIGACGDEQIAAGTRAADAPAMFTVENCPEASFRSGSEVLNQHTRCRGGRVIADSLVEPLAWIGLLLI